QERRREIDQEPLRPVRHQKGDLVAAPHPEGPEPPGDLSSAGARLAVAQALRGGDDEFAAGLARRDLVQQVRQGTASRLDRFHGHEERSRRSMSSIRALSTSTFALSVARSRSRISRRARSSAIRASMRLSVWAMAWYSCSSRSRRRKSSSKWPRIPP